MKSLWVIVLKSLLILMASASSSLAQSFDAVYGEVSPAYAGPGPVTIQVQITAVDPCKNCNVLLSIADQNAVPIGPQKGFNATFSGGDMQSFTWTYTVDQNTPLGTWTLVAGVFGPNYQGTYLWQIVTTETFVSSPPEAWNDMWNPGVNLAGGDFNGPCGGVYGRDYVYPTTEEIDHYAAAGMNIIRIPFLISRLQPQNNQPLSTSELALIDPLVQHASQLGVNIILDAHDYGRMCDNSGIDRVIGVDPLMPNSTFADFCTREAQHYSGYGNVVFGIMNEPSNDNQSAVLWKASAVACQHAIRATGAGNFILIPGVDFDGCHSWISSGNGDAWAGFWDQNFAIECHQYLDSNFSGTSPYCQEGNGGEQTLGAITQWAYQNGVYLFLGETGSSQDPSCPTEWYRQFNYMAHNAAEWGGVWVGDAAWAGGPWWSPSYMYLLHDDNSPYDNPQMSILPRTPP